MAACLALKLRLVARAGLRSNRLAAEHALRVLEGSRERRATGAVVRLPRQDVDSVTRLMRDVQAGRVAPVEVSPGLVRRALELMNRAEAKVTRFERKAQEAWLLFSEHERKFPRAADEQRVKEVAAKMGLTERTVRRYVRSRSAPG